MKSLKGNSSRMQRFYLVLILLASVCMGIGYASINSISIGIEGKIIAQAPDGIFITEANYKSNVNADIAASEILYAYQSNLNSYVVLSETDPNSSITYEITIYNSEIENYVFEKVNYLEQDETYSNAGIEFELDGLQPGDILASKQSITFTITFYYKDNVLADNNTLDSLLNFSFKTDSVVPTVSLMANKVTSETEVMTDNWSNEGLNFILNAETVGISGATIYYCKDTTNSCEPTTVATSGTMITEYNSLVQDIYYIRYMIKNGLGVSSEISSFTAKVDNIVPTLQLVDSGRYEYDNTDDIIQSATYGISGAKYYCVNTKDNSSVTTISSVNSLGLSNISCTITSNAGLSSTYEETYKVSWTISGSDQKLGITNGAYRSGSSILLPHGTQYGAVQYGPYAKASKGCYRVFYWGNNLNAYPSGYSVIATYDNSVTAINISNLNYVSSDSNYYFELTQDATNIETKLINLSSTATITIDQIRIYYYGTTCP